MDAFVSNKDASSLVVAIAGLVWKRDPLMRSKRLVVVPTITEEQSKSSYMPTKMKKN